MTWVTGVFCQSSASLVARQVLTRGNKRQGSDLVVLAKGRVRGLRLAATDGPFTSGSGPLVSGTTLALIMAMTGRTLYCDELAGEGVSTVRDGDPRKDAAERAHERETTER